MADVRSQTDGLTNSEREVATTWHMAESLSQRLADTKTLREYKDMMREYSFFPGWTVVKGLLNGFWSVDSLSNVQMDDVYDMYTVYYSV